MPETRVKNAVTCTICQSPADLINGMFYQCQKNPGHMGDTIVGIFSDCTYRAEDKNEEKGGPGCIKLYQPLSQSLGSAPVSF